MNYLEFYQLAREPFTNSPESRFWFNSAQHAQATLRLERAVAALDAGSIRNRCTSR